MKIDFRPALDEMERSDSPTFGPCEFAGYCKKHGFAIGNTAASISIDSVSRLDSALRNENTMVFRLGKHAGTGTSFGLARAESGSVNEFFIDDAECYGKTSPQLFLPNVPARVLFPFQLLPKLTETSLVNLAVGSGVLYRALDLDGQVPSTPATGQSTLTFSFKPTPLADAWCHNQGQVEIDAMFTAVRNGRETLFVVEAKSGQPTADLAKHKLVYPLAVLREVVPDYIDVVPVYLKAWSEKQDRHFLVVECELPETATAVVTALTPKRSQQWVLRGF